MPKGKKITKQEIKEGGIYIASDDCSGCWRAGGEPIPFRVNRLVSSNEVEVEMTSLNKEEDISCACSDLDKLYEWIEDDVFQPKRGDLVLVRDSNKDEWRERIYLTSVETSYPHICNSDMGDYQQYYVGWKQMKPLQSRTVDDILSELSEEDREIIRLAMK